MRRYRLEVCREGKWFTVTKRAYATVEGAIRGAKKLEGAVRIVDYEKWFNGVTKANCVVKWFDYD